MTLPSMSYPPPGHQPEQRYGDSRYPPDARQPLDQRSWSSESPTNPNGYPPPSDGRYPLPPVQTAGERPRYDDRQPFDERRQYHEQQYYQGPPPGPGRGGAPYPPEYYQNRYPAPYPYGDYPRGGPNGPQVAQPPPQQAAPRQRTSIACRYCRKRKVEMRRPPDQASRVVADMILYRFAAVGTQIRLTANAPTATSCASTVSSSPSRPTRRRHSCQSLPSQAACHREHLCMARTASRSPPRPARGSSSEPILPHRRNTRRPSTRLMCSIMKTGIPRAGDPALPRKTTRCVSPRRITRMTTTRDDVPRLRTTAAARLRLLTANISQEDMNKTERPHRTRTAREALRLYRLSPSRHRHPRLRRQATQ